MPKEQKITHARKGGSYTFEELEDDVAKRKARAAAKASTGDKLAADRAAAKAATDKVAADEAALKTPAQPVAAKTPA